MMLTNTAVILYDGDDIISKKKASDYDQAFLLLLSDYFQKSTKKEKRLINVVKKEPNVSQIYSLFEFMSQS